MNLWIKICGNTSFEDANLAAEAGADAVGFVFAPSPRQVTARQVSKIIPRLPEAVEKIGVFVDATTEEIETTVRESRLSGVQLHFDAHQDLPARLRARFGRKLRILRVWHYQANAAAAVAALAKDTNLDAVLLDSRTATAVGGTGIPFDWNRASSELQYSGTNRRLIVAGGLTPANVSDAIQKFHPWGVDVVSGVESAPGIKDVDKVRAFIAKARAASGTGKQEESR